MAVQTNKEISQACEAFISGKIVAYPTESVFGLGCLATDIQALNKLRVVKNRSNEKGFIVLCSSVEQMIEQFPQLVITQKDIALLRQKQSHPTTWIIQASERFNEALHGKNTSLALRVSEHTTIRAICAQVGPIVSTSANKEGQKPGMDLDAIKNIFSDEVDYYLDGQLGHAQSPSQIIELHTQKIIRKA